MLRFDLLLPEILHDCFMALDFIPHSGRQPHPFSTYKAEGVQAQNFGEEE